MCFARVGVLVVVLTATSTRPCRGCANVMEGPTPREFRERTICNVIVPLISLQRFLGLPCSQRDACPAPLPCYSVSMMRPREASSQYPGKIASRGPTIPARFGVSLGWRHWQMSPPRCCARYWDGGGNVTGPQVALWLNMFKDSDRVSESLCGSWRSRVLLSAEKHNDTEVFPELTSLAKQLLWYVPHAAQSGYG